MSTPKNYFLAPDHDLSSDGSLVLGGIILKPLDPKLFNEGEVINVPIRSIHSTHKYNWEHTVEDARGGRMGVWTQFVNILGFGGIFEANLDNKSFTQYRFQHLETTDFNPTQAYVEKAVKKPTVRAYLEGCGFDLPLYMVTGLKIVRGPGAEMIERKTRRYEGHARLGVSTPFGSPYVVDSGDMTGYQASSQGTSFGGASDFIFAYRLSKISFKKEGDQDPLPRQERYRTAGGMLGINSEHEDDDCLSDFMEDLTIGGEDAVRRDLPNMVPLAAFDESDDKECQCFVVPWG